MSDEKWVVYLSTDYVFDGEKKEPYDEWDVPNPINRYGLSKLMGEKFVTALTNRYYIARTSWLYGSKGNVITSYSIHYTKLYDSGPPLPGKQDPDWLKSYLCSPGLQVE